MIELVNASLADTDFASCEGIHWVSELEDLRPGRHVWNLIDLQVRTVLEIRQRVS